MKADTHTATFLILERDPVVRMDIQEMLLRSFQGWTVIVVDSLDELPQALGATRGRRIAIISADAETFASGLAKIDPDGPVGAVLITEGPIVTAPSPIPYAVVQRPFKSEHLLTAVKSALEPLHSSR